MSPRVLRELLQNHIHWGWNQRVHQKWGAEEPRSRDTVENPLKLGIGHQMESHGLPQKGQTQVHRGWEGCAGPLLVHTCSPHMLSTCALHARAHRYSSVSPL